jgi:hypothetical protein
MRELTETEKDAWWAENAVKQGVRCIYCRQGFNSRSNLGLAQAHIPNIGLITMGYHVDPCANNADRRLKEAQNADA